MSLITNLQGRLRNTSLPYSKGLLPLFEAVANSIHSIEDAASPSRQGRISVEIIRDTQTGLNFEGDHKKPGPEAREDIVGFRVIDNGIGFNQQNMNSFKELDSNYKAVRGGRGVGRLLWLKAFRRARISSIFFDSDGKAKKRTFIFNSTEGISEENVEDATTQQRETIVELEGFQQRYRNATRKTAPAIANELFEHCLWYFIREGSAPHIVVQDANEVIELDQIYDETMISASTTETLSIKEESFELLHVRLRAHLNRSHMLAFCAANRLVKEENIRGKIPGLFGCLADEAGDFVYQCYVSSKFLDERVRSERTEFDIDEEPVELFGTTEISLKDIRDGVLKKATDYLSEYLKQNLSISKEKVETFISGKAPRYRPIISRIPEDQLNIDPNISDKELDVVLHKHLMEIESQLLVEGHDIMEPKVHENYFDYRQRLRHYLEKADDIKKSSLADYVFHRRIILDLLEIAIKRKSDGKYEREDLIHNLIMPMRIDSTEVMLDSCNLWLIDERLAFHDYLASDKTLSSMPITDSTETKEPDILALNVFDNPILVSEGDKLPLASIIVVELKRPMRNDAREGEDKDPIEQSLDYLERIRQGRVTTASGRLIPGSGTIPGFCYVICDITPTIEKRCKLKGAQKTSDGMGYFLYNDNYKAYVEVISFDRLVNAARERNKAFFDKLGLPTT